MDYGIQCMIGRGHDAQAMADCRAPPFPSYGVSYDAARCSTV